MGASGNLFMMSGTLGNAVNQYGANNTKANYADMQGAANRRLAAISEAQVLKQGDLQGDEAIRRGNIIAGTQTARFASQGVDVHGGSASATVNQTQDIASADAAMAHNNAWRQAWGMEVQSTEATGQERLEALGDRATAVGSLISGGLQAAAYGAKAGEAYYKNAKPGGSSSRGAGGSGLFVGDPGSADSNGELHTQASEDDYSGTTWSSYWRNL